MQSGVFVSSLPWWQANTGRHQQGWSSSLQDIQWCVQYLHQLQWTVLDGSGIGGWLGCFQGRHYYISSVESIISIQTGMSGAWLQGSQSFLTWPVGEWHWGISGVRLLTRQVWRIWSSQYSQDQVQVWVLCVMPSAIPWQHWNAWNTWWFCEGSWLSDHSRGVKTHWVSPMIHYILLRWSNLTKQCLSKCC